MSFCLLFLLSSINKSFPSTYCGCWTLSEALAIQGFSWTERRAYICRMDPLLPCSSVTICLFSCPEFFCSMNNNNKSIPLVGPGSWGRHREESKLGTLEENRCLLCCFGRPPPAPARLQALVPFPACLHRHVPGLGTLVRCEKD